MGEVGLAGDDQPERRVDLTAAEGEAGGAGGEQCLVDIEVLYGAGVDAVLLGEPAGEALGEVVTDRIGVAGPFALDELDRRGVGKSRGYRKVHRWFLFGASSAQ